MPRTVQDIDAAIAADRARQLAKIATRDRRNQDMLSALRDIEEYERQIRADETAMEQLFAMVEPAQGGTGHAAAARPSQRSRRPTDGDRGARHVSRPGRRPAPDRDADPSLLQRLRPEDHPARDATLDADRGAHRTAGRPQLRAALARRSTCAGSLTVGSRMSSSTPASRNAAMASLIDSGDRCALPAIIAAISGPRNP
jgi:hypothetical protein